MVKEINPYDITGSGAGIKDKSLPGFSFRQFEGNLSPSGNTDIQTLKPAVTWGKLKYLGYFTLIIFLLLGGKTVYLGAFKGGYYRDMAEGNRLRIQSIKSPRGIFFDRNGRQLVKNVPNFTLAVTPGDLPKVKEEREKIIKELSLILHEEPTTFWSILDQASNYSFDLVILKEHINYQEALLLNIKITEFPGVSVLVNSQRDYEGGEIFSHILGYMGKITEKEFASLKKEDYLFTDYLGKDGLERSYEYLLKGKKGKQMVEVDSQGKVVKVVTQTEPEAGLNLILSLDSQLQEKLTEELKKSLEKTRSPGGAAVALDPRNGEILALVSLPSFDNNELVKGISQAEFNNFISRSEKPLFNRAVSGEYPSGSTIKPVFAAAALEEKIVTENTQILSEGGIRIDKWFFPDWKSGGHGLTDIKKALAESVNTYFYLVGGGKDDFVGLGLDRMRKYAEIFGLNGKLGVDLPSEAKGFLPTKEWKKETTGEPWYIGDTYNLAIGQGNVLVTPLQVASYTAAIANGGTLYTPHFLKSTTDDKNREIDSPAVKVIRNNIISINNLKVVAEGLRQGVLSGSSRSLSDLPFSSAGKTGTAQTGKGDKTHAWFTAYAPYESPEIVITVLLEEGGGGESVALPVAKETLKWYFTFKK